MEPEILVAELVSPTVVVRIATEPARAARLVAAWEADGLGTARLAPLKLAAGPADGDPGTSERRAEPW